MSGRGVYRHRFPIENTEVSLDKLKQLAKDEIAAICYNNCWRRLSPTMVAVEHGKFPSIVTSTEVAFITRRKKAV